MSAAGTRQDASGAAYADSARAMGGARRPSESVIAFRDAALRDLFSPRERADVLRLPPRWLTAATLLLTVLAALAAIAAFRMPIPTYASGPAVLWPPAAHVMTSPAAGRVERIDVIPGEYVRRGQRLLGLAALGDAPDHQVGTVRFAGVVAPMDGIVTDFQIRLEQEVADGERLFVIRPRAADTGGIALLPGHQLPLLRAGQDVQLSHGRHRGLRAAGRVVYVADEPVPAREVHGFFPADATVPLPAAVAVAWIEADTRTWPAGAMDDGVRAAVHVGDNPLLRWWSRAGE